MEAQNGKTPSEEEVRCWSEEEVADYLSECLPHAKGKIRNIIITNEISGRSFLNFGEEKWKEAGTSIGMTSCFMQLASEIKPNTDRFHGESLKSPSSLQARRTTAPPPIAQEHGRSDDPRVPVIEDKSYKQLRASSLPTVEDIFVNYGKNGTSAGARALKNVGHSEQWCQMLAINRVIKEQIEINFPMFTKVYFRPEKGHWNRLREKVTSELLCSGKLKPIVFRLNDGSSHELHCPQDYILERISNILTQRRSRLSKARKQRMSYNRKYIRNKTEVELLASDESLQLDDEALEFLTLLWQARFKLPRIYSKHLEPIGTAVVLRQRTVAGYTLLTVRLKDKSSADRLVPHSRARMQDLEKGCEIEWPECLTRMHIDPHLKEMDQNEEEDEGDVQAPINKQFVQIESGIGKGSQPRGKKRSIQGTLPLAKRQEIDRQTQAELRIAELTTPLKLKAKEQRSQEPQKLVPPKSSQPSNQPCNEFIEIGSIVSLLNSSGETIGTGRVDAVDGDVSVHNSKLGTDHVRLLVESILPGMEDQLLPDKATSDDDCKTLQDAVAFGNKTLLRWPAEQLGIPSNKRKKDINVDEATHKELKEYCKANFGFKNLPAIEDLKDRIREDRKKGTAVPEKIDRIVSSVECFREYVRYKISL